MLRGRGLEPGRRMRAALAQGHRIEHQLDVLTVIEEAVGNLGRRAERAAI